MRIGYWCSPGWLRHSDRAVHTPVLVFQAEQGSGKSTTARFLRSLVDPNAAALRSEPPRGTGPDDRRDELLVHRAR